MLEAARVRGLGRVDIELQCEANAIFDVHGCHRKIGLVIRVTARPVCAHSYPARQVARLDAAVYSVSSRIQDVERAGCRISEFGTQYLVAVPADDQECVAGGIGIDGHKVIAERSGKTGRGFGVLYRDLLVQVLVCEPSPHLRQGLSVHGVDESLYVYVEYLRWLRLGADIGQKETVAANQG